jgi:hypothetical protein
MGGALGPRRPDDVGPLHRHRQRASLWLPDDAEIVTSAASHARQGASPPAQAA